MDKNKAMQEYLMQCPEIESFVRFNVSVGFQGDTSFQSISSTAWVERYPRGKGIKDLNYALVQIKPHDTGTSAVNFEQFFDVEKVMDWITEQGKNGNFPDFGEKEKVFSIEVMENMPNISAVSEDGGTCKYMFQLRVRYVVE